MAVSGPYLSDRSLLRRRAIKTVVFGAVFLSLAALLFGIAGTLWLRRAMRVSLPQLQGSLQVAALSQPVTVRRDRVGVPHIQAQNLDDLVVAQGYVTAQDRLWQMDMLRRYAAGDMAEVLGRGQLPHDRAERTLQMRAAAAAALQAMPPADRRFLADYARGVNAYIAQNRSRLPAEFRVLAYRPAPWQPVDSVLVGLNLAQSLSMDFPVKLAREKLAAKLPPALMQDLYPVGSWRDHPPVSTTPDITAPQEIPQVPLDASQVRLQMDDLLRLKKLLPSSFVSGCGQCAPGSNEWVVSGEHSVTGMPLLSNDMHLTHTIPDTWYEAQLTSGDFNVTGVTLPGIPFVVVGHNAHIAWGFTLLYADVQDIYVERTRGDMYRTADGWRPFQHVRETIRVRGGHDVTIDVLRTDHGPVVTPLLPHEKRTLALQWTIYDPTALTLPFYEIDSAANWEQFRAAMALFGGPPQNAVYADTQGNIGYQAVGKVPLRPHGLAALPVVDFNHEWQGYVPFEQMPSVYNPPGGILATANARVTPDDDPQPLTLNWGPPYRNERIWKVLGSKPKLSAADMLALQNDIDSTLDREMAQKFTYAIDHTARPGQRLREAADLMRSWDGRMTVASPAAALVVAARSALWPMLLRPKLGRDWRLYQWGESAFVQEQIVADQSRRWLPPGYANWNDFLAAAVQYGMARFHAPADVKAWRYGDFSKVEVEHPLYGMVPWLRRWTGTGILPQSGDDVTVKQVGRTFGPSERLTVDFSNLDDSTLNIVIGQSGDPLSPYYMDQWPHWYNGTTFPLPFSDAAVQASATHTLTLTP
jgi:penicillin amidase